MPQHTQWRTAPALPDFIVRNKAQTLQIKVYNASGTLTAPVSGTLTLTKADGTEAVSSQAVSVVSSIATYDLSAAEVPTTDSISDKWYADWALTMTGGETHTFRRSCHLIRSDLWPTVTVLDLSARHQNISRLIASGNTADAFVDHAWDFIRRALLKQGRMPWRVLDSSDLHEALEFKALEMIFRDGHTAAGDGKYLELSEYYEGRFNTEWATISIEYDFDDDGVPDHDDVATVQGPTTLGGPGAWGYYS